MVTVTTPSVLGDSQNRFPAAEQFYFKPHQYARVTDKLEMDKREG